MNFYLYVALNLSILIPGIIALFRYRSIEGRYYPFFYFIFIGCINECLSIMLAFRGHQTLVNSNIYVLMEAILLSLLFYTLGLIKNRLTLYLFIASLLLVWLWENFLLHTISINSTYFRIYYSFAITFMSIEVINKQIFNSYKHLLKDATFIMSVGFIIYYTYKALIQALVIYGIDRKSSFLLNIYVVMIYVNFTANLLYALALLWMPKKVKYLKPLHLPFL